MNTTNDIDKLAASVNAESERRFEGHAQNLIELGQEVERLMAALEVERADHARTRDDEERQAWDACLIAAASMCAARASVVASVDGSRTNPLEEVSAAAVRAQADELLEERRKKWGGK